MNLNCPIRIDYHFVYTELVPISHKYTNITHIEESRTITQNPYMCTHTHCQ